MSRPTRRAAALSLSLLAIGCSLLACSSGDESSDGTESGVRLRLAMLPQIAQAGDAPAPAASADHALTATVRPAHAGQEVVLQQREDDGWQRVAAARADDRGVAEFTVPHGEKPETYRLMAGADGRQVVSNTANTDRWSDPAFDDEFSGQGLGVGWSDRLGGYSPDSKRACSKADPRAVEVGGGLAELSVMKDPDRPGHCTYEGKQYDWRLNGHIGTQAFRSFTYGYAAARIKFQDRRGQHGSFWLQPASRTAQEGDPSKTGAEIDVIEGFGEHHPYGGLASFAYSFPDDGKPGVTAKKTGGFVKNPDRFGDDWSKKFHVFSVEWTPEHYVFRIDGRETFRTSQGVSGRPQFLILSLLSSDYELGLLGGDESLPQTMSVDWVRFWNR